MIDPLMFDEVADCLDKIHHCVSLKAAELADERQRILNEELIPMLADKDTPVQALIEAVGSMIQRAHNHEKMRKFVRNLECCKEDFKAVDEIANLCRVDAPI